MCLVGVPCLDVLEFPEGAGRTLAVEPFRGKFNLALTCWFDRQGMSCTDFEQSNHIQPTVSFIPKTEKNRGGGGKTKITWLRAIPHELTTIQQIPPQPRDFDSKFPSALLDIKQNHWRILASRSGSILAGYSAGSTGKGYSAGYSAGSTGELLWDAQRDARRDVLAGCSGGILGGIHWRAALAGYSAGSTGEQLDQLLWRDTRRDPLASRSGGILGGIHWRAALAGYSAGSTGEPLWRDPLASSSGEQLWRDTWRVHWRAALAG